ncbi:hypothetical protein [Streptomyces tsukubensis]|uniref:hypothetical protein n=1 Tax=Streptomyces tsukubensis TaxID=83656 RepID=UPI00344D50E2
MTTIDLPGQSTPYQVQVPRTVAETAEQAAAETAAPPLPPVSGGDGRTVIPGSAGGNGHVVITW